MVAAILGRQAANSTTLKELKIGGGGYTTHIDIADDGSLLCGIDIFGAYIWSSTRDRWEQLFTEERIPEYTWFDPLGVSGSYDIRFAPSNSSIIYAFIAGNNSSLSCLFKSIDKGRTFQRLNFNYTVISNETSGYRLWGPKIAVDPINPDHVLVSTASNGLFRTLDGGKTFAQVSGIPANSSGNAAAGHMPCFDKLGGTTGGKTDKFYALSYGNGVYEVTSVGGSGSLQAGSPTFLRNMCVGASGRIHAVDGTNIYRRNTGTWSTVWSSGLNPSAICVDNSSNYAATTRICVVGAQGEYLESSDSGATFTALAATGSYMGQDYTSDCDWMTTTIGGTGYSISQCRFDPTQSNSFYTAFGIGVAKGAPNLTSFTMAGQTRGIESLVMGKIVAPTSTPGQALVGVWDQGVIQSNLNPDRYAVSSGRALPFTSFKPCYHLDKSHIDGTVVASIWDGSSTDFSAKSLNGGVSWSAINTPTVVTLTTSASSSASTTLTFSSVPATVKLGMYIPGLSQAVVIAKSATTVTTDIPVTVGSGVAVSFILASGASQIIPSTATNWLFTLSDRNPSNFYTTDAGVTWNPVTFSDCVDTYGVRCTTTSGSNIITITEPGFDATVKFQSGDGPIGVVGVNGGTRLYSSSGDPPYISGVTDATHVTLTKTPDFSGNTILQPHAGFNIAYYGNYMAYCADSVTSGKFYAMNVNRGRCYVSTDNGATFAPTAATGLAGSPYFVRWSQNGSLKAVPNNAGYLVWAAGSVPMIRSTNAGVSWAVVPNVTSVGTFGFGKAKPGGGGHPAVYLVGTVSGVEGLHRSDDFDQATPTWTTIIGNTNQKKKFLGQLNGVTDIVGDLNVWGKFYGLMGHAGFYGYVNSATT